MFVKNTLSALLRGEVKNVLINTIQQQNRGFLFPEITSVILPSVRSKWNDVTIEKPKPGNGYYRRTVHYPEKYTLKPVPTTNLAGRDQITGRVVVGTLGGGLKHPFLWVDYKRIVPEGEPPLVERVLEVIPEPNRTAHVALVGNGDKLRYILATENMKPGDMITTSNELTRMAVRAKEGDAYPLGSLPIGSAVCCVEARPGEGGLFARAAGTQCTIIRKVDDRVVVVMPNKHEFSFDRRCMAVVGRISNAIHSSIPIGSPNRLRWLGNRPRSGWWQRKSGKHGRKVRKLPPCQEMRTVLPQDVKRMKMTLDDFPYHKP